MAFSFLFLAISMTGQTDLNSLKRAVKNDACHLIQKLDSNIKFNSEEEKYYTAICLYKTGKTKASISLFEDLYPAYLKVNTAFWLARGHAKMDEASKAMSYLNNIPKNALNVGMLSNPEFEKLSASNKAFQKLKAEITPGFNFWTAVLSFTAAIGFILSFLFFMGKTSFTIGSGWMGLILFSFSTILTSYILMWTRYSTEFPYLNNVWNSFIYLIGPATYFYVLSIFKEETKNITLLKHFAFPFLCILMMTPLIFGFRSTITGNLFRIGSSAHLMIGHLCLYTFLVYNLIQNDWQVDTNIKRWSEFIIKGLGLFTVAFVSYFVLVNTSFFNPQWDYAVSGVMAAGILTIGYMGLIQKRIFSSEPIEKFIPTTKYKSSSLTQSASQSIVRKMEILMKEQQVFKENELRLDDLASYLDISRHQLSQVINEHYGINFFEFINSRRIAHVKYMLENPKYDHYTIQQLAFEAGFNNKASFNRYFKREYGLTPSAFRIKVSEEGRQ